MVILYLIIALESALLLWLTIDKAKHGGSGRNALTSAHELVKVYWKDSDYSRDRGWAWKCTCGGSALIDSYNNPTEERALNAWKKHKSLYVQLAVDTGEDKYKILYEDSKKELEKVKSACYCKDIH